VIDKESIKNKFRKKKPNSTRFFTSFFFCSFPRQINGLIAQLEEDEKGYSHRKEFLALEKQLATTKRNYDSLSEEYDIAMLDPKEAHAKFVARVNDQKQVHSSLFYIELIIC
jgi:hypothetical protein